MKFSTLTVDNFMSIKHCEVDLADRGLVLIQGDNTDEDTFESNGAGKSTLFSDAPTWCIYGETPRGYKADKVINRHVGKNTRVSLKTIHDSGDVYEIVRHRKHKEHKNHVLLFRNGENITAKSDSDTDKKIIELFELDFLSFTNSVMFGQGITNMFANATDGEQKKILERMLQIDIFKACQEKAKEHLSSLQEKRSTLISDSNVNKKELETLERYIDDLQSKEADLAINVEKRINTLRDELNKLDGQLSALPDTSEQDAHRDKIHGLVLKLQQKIGTFKEYEDSKLELSGDIRSLQSDISRLSREIASYKSKRDTAKRSVGEEISCNECGQVITEEHKMHHLSTLDFEVYKREKEVKEAQAEIQKLTTLLEGVNKVLAGKDIIEEQKTQLQVEIATIRAEIQSVSDKKISLESSMRNIRNQIKQQQDMADTTYVDLISQSLDRVDLLKQTIAQQFDALDNLSTEYDKYEFWVDAFSNQGIKSVLLDSVTPFLNTRANHYLGRLSGSSIEVEFVTQATLKNGDKKDKFSVEVTNKNGDNDYKGNSNGEKRRIDLAINLALQDLVASRSSKSLDFIIYDECFEGLDSVGCENLIGILQDKQSQYGTIMVITHNDALKQLFSKSIVVSKRDGNTTIRSEE